jgi:acetolactate synthase small subunit
MSSADSELIRFAILAENHPDVLARVVMLFHRLNIEIRVVSIDRTQGSPTTRLRVTVEGREEQADRLQAQLRKIVQVHSVNVL